MQAATPCLECPHNNCCNGKHSDKQWQLATADMAETAPSARGGSQPDAATVGDMNCLQHKCEVTTTRVLVLDLLPRFTMLCEEQQQQGACGSSHTAYRLVHSLARFSNSCLSARI